MHIKQKLKSVFGFIISGILLLLIYINFPENHNINHLSNANIFYIIVALLIRSIIFFLQMLRWHLIINNSGVNYNKLLSCIVVSYLPNYLFMYTGLLSRVFLLGYTSKLKHSYIVGTLLVEKLYDFALLALLLLLFIFFSPLSIWIPYEYNFTIKFVLGTIICITFFFILFPTRLVKILKNLINRLNITKYQRINAVLKNQKEVLVSLKSFQKRFQLSGLTIIIILLNIIVFYAVMISVGIKGLFMSAILLYMTLLVSKIIPSIGELGIFQYICILVLSEVSIDYSIALIYSIILYLVIKLPGIVLGLLILPTIQKAK
jgi:glycosyltransferase 2 family protein